MNTKYKRFIITLHLKNWIKKSIEEYHNLHDKTLDANAQVKQRVLQFLPFLVASVIAGTVAYLYSQLFTYCEKISEMIFHKDKRLIFLITPVSFVLSWWLVKRFAPFAKGSGVPQVMAAIDLAKPKQNKLITYLLSFRIIIIKILSSAIKVVGGGVLGREGPTIQISGAIFNQTYKLLPKWWTPISQQNLLIAGSASGLAAAFNTPLGGIIFAIEELSKFHIKYYKSPLFIAVIIAGLTAQGFGGNYLYLAYPKTDLSGFRVIFGVLITAILSGYFASKMAQLLVLFLNFVNKQKKILTQLGVVLGCAFIVAFTIFFFGTETMGSGKEIMERTLYTDVKSVPWYLPFLRMNSMVFSFGFGGAGGVFAPSLSSGACFGALVSQALQLSAGNANLLILIGMASFLTGITRAPFTSAIIIFEMTDRHSIIFYLFIGAIIANIVATAVSKHSFYDILKDNYLKEIKSKAK